jgi:hypothetical protein
MLLCYFFYELEEKLVIPLKEPRRFGTNECVCIVGVFITFTGGCFVLRLNRETPPTVRSSSYGRRTRGRVMRIRVLNVI